MKKIALSVLVATSLFSSVLNADELAINGDFSNGTSGYIGWSQSPIENENNTLKVTTGVAHSTFTPSGIAQKEGETLRIEFDVYDEDGGWYRVYDGLATQSIGYSNPKEWTRLSIDLTSQGDYNYIPILKNGGGTFFVDNFSVVETNLMPNSPIREADADNLISNWNFSNGTNDFIGWTQSPIENENNTLKVTTGHTNSTFTPVGIAQENGKTLTIEFDVYDEDGGWYRVYDGSSTQSIGYSNPKEWTRLSIDLTSQGNYNYIPILKNGGGTFYVDNIVVKNKDLYTNVSVSTQEELVNAINNNDNVNIITNSTVELSSKMSFSLNKDKSIKFTNPSFNVTGTANTLELFAFTNNGHTLEIDGLNINANNLYQRVLTATGSLKLTNSDITGAYSANHVSIGVYNLVADSNSIIEIDGNHIHDIIGPLSGNQTTGSGASRAIYIDIKSDVTNVKTYIRNNNLHDVYGLEGDIIHYTQNNSYHDEGTELFILDNEIRKSNRRQLKLRGSRVTVQGNTIESDLSNSIYYIDPSTMMDIYGTTEYKSQNIVVSDNTFINNGGTGKSLGLVDVALVNVYSNTFTGGGNGAFLTKAENHTNGIINIYDNDIEVKYGNTELKGAAELISFYNNRWTVKAAIGTPNWIVDNIDSANIKVDGDTWHLDSTVTDKGTFQAIYFFRNSGTLNMDMQNVVVTGDTIHDNDYRYNLCQFFGSPISGAYFGNNSVQNKSDIYFENGNDASGNIFE